MPGREIARARVGIGVMVRVGITVSVRVSVSVGLRGFAHGLDTGLRHACRTVAKSMQLSGWLSLCRGMPTQLSRPPLASAVLTRRAVANSCSARRATSVHVSSCQGSERVRLLLSSGVTVSLIVCKTQDTVETTAHGVHIKSLAAGHTCPPMSKPPRHHDNPSWPHDIWKLCMQSMPNCRGGGKEARTSMGAGVTPLKWLLSTPAP